MEDIEKVNIIKESQTETVSIYNNFSDTEYETLIEEPIIPTIVIDGQGHMVDDIILDDI
jgi:DNA gyrase/topoisomerase IV subunit A